jgi:c-di-GMP-binding flagellar brake protein YcgR
LGGAAAWAVPALAALELYRVTRTLVRHVRRRQLRRVFRFPVRTGVRIDGAGLSALGRITDLNPVGASVVLPRALPPGSTVRLRCALPDARGGEQRLDVRAAVLSCAPVTGSVTLGTYRAGLRFTDVPAESARALVEYCFVVAARDRLRGPVAPAPRRPAADAARTA